MVHDHHHHHQHVQRDFFSGLESWLGIDGGGQGGEHGGHPKTTDQPAVSTVIVTAEPTTITGKPEKTSPAGVGPPVQQTHATETTHTTKQKETTTTKHTTTSTSTSTTSTSTSTTTTKKQEKTTTTLSTSTSSTSTSTTIDPRTTTFSTATAALSTTSALTAALDQASSTSSPSASASAAASSSGGLSGGAKAGIAIGVLLGVAAIAGIVLFWLHKQKKRKQEEEAAEAAAIDREKSFALAANSQPARNYNANSTSPTSPFGARPANQFNPAYGQPSAGAVGAGIGAGVAGAAAASAATNASRGNQSPWSANPNSPSTRQDPFTDPENPFDGSARSSPPTSLANDGSAQSSQVRELTPSPTGSSPPGVPSALTAGKPPTPPGEAAAAGVAAGAIGGAAIVAAAAAGKKSEENRQQSTPSPEYREGSPENGYSSRPQSPAMGGAPLPSNVHRVQMGFTPSLGDEMELRAGQLVRLLKAYDDGWTQCSTMDGSITGIAPRSCLSARPLQPRRPPGPGQGPPRGGPPIMGPNGRPMSPAGGRPPNGGGPPRFYQDGRPMTPTQQFPAPPTGSRSMSPGPSEMPRPLTPGGSSRPSSPSTGGGRARSNSNRPVVQAGPSPLAPPTGPLPSTPAQANDQPPEPSSSIGRKPVPGQQ